MNLSHHEIKLVVEEVEQVLLPARIQKVFESSPKVLVLQLRAPGQTHYLLLSVEPDDTRLHIVESKPRQPDHPSAFTMQLRKWAQGAWIESVEVLETDRIVHLDLQAIDPDWIPEREDEKAPRTSLRLVVELLGQHPTIFLIDKKGRIIGRSQGRILGERPSGVEERYQSPPPPPPTADDEKGPTRPSNARQTVRTARRDQAPGEASTSVVQHVEARPEQRIDAPRRRGRRPALTALRRSDEPGDSHDAGRNDRV